MQTLSKGLRRYRVRMKYRNASWGRSVARETGWFVRAVDLTTAHVLAQQEPVYIQYADLYDQVQLKIEEVN